MSRPACPKCGSTNTDFDGVELPCSLVWCRECGHQWETPCACKPEEER